MPTMTRSLGERANDRAAIARGELELHIPSLDPRCDDAALEALIDRAALGVAETAERLQVALRRVFGLEQARLRLRQQADSLAYSARQERQREAAGEQYAALGRQLVDAEKARGAADFEAVDALREYNRLVRAREAIKRDLAAAAAGVLTLDALAASIAATNRRNAASGSAERVELCILRDPRSVGRGWVAPPPAPARRAARDPGLLPPLQPARWRS